MPKVQPGRTGPGRTQRKWPCLRTAVAAGAALVVLSSSGCAEPAPPPTIAVRDAPASPARLTLSKPAKGGLTPRAKWPKACDLVTHTDIQAILPDATAIEHRGLEATIEVSDHVGLARLRQITVPQQACHIEFELPQPDGGESLPSSTRIQIALEAVGSPQVARMNYNEVGDVVEGSGADECHRLVDTNYNCRVGGVVFTVDGSAAPDVRFEGQQAEVETFYGHHVLREFVKLVAAKLASPA